MEIILTNRPLKNVFEAGRHHRSEPGGVVLAKAQKFHWVFPP